MRSILFLLCLALFPSVASAESSAGYKSIEVAPGITMLNSSAGFPFNNVGLLIGTERIVLIDDGVEQLGPELLEITARLAGRPADFVINTHLHGDHTGSNALLSAEGAIIIAHDNVRSRMADSNKEGAALPILTFSEEVTLHINGLEARVFHVESAHTDGDAVIHFPTANVIQTGDAMFHHMFPFIDLDNGGTVNGYIASQQALLELADENTVIMPGHGELASKADLGRDLEVLIDSKKRVQVLLDKGMSEAEIVEANPLAIYHEGWTWGFITTEKMTRTLVRGLIQ